VHCNNGGQLHNPAGSFNKDAPHGSNTEGGMKAGLFCKRGMAEHSRTAFGVFAVCIAAVFALVLGHFAGGTNTLRVFADSYTQTWWAFGDSITAGEGVGIDNSYANQFAAKSNFELNNLAVSGHTSADCLTLLNGMTTAQWDSMHHSDGVILCIGANDILSVAATVLGDISTAPVVLQSAEFQTAMQTAITNFETNYIAILERLKNDNIIALTIYNPYSGVTAGGFNLGLLTEIYIEQLNGIIKQHAPQYFDMFYYVKLYENEHGKPPVFADFTDITNINYDPHLTLAGQSYVAEQLNIFYHDQTDNSIAPDHTPKGILRIILLCIAVSLIFGGMVILMYIRNKRRS
jgi:lysophospholipase L1-like esterase